MVPFINKLFPYLLKSAEKQSGGERADDKWFICLLSSWDSFLCQHEITDVLEIMNSRENKAGQWIGKAIFQYSKYFVSFLRFLSVAGSQNLEKLLLSMNDFVSKLCLLAFNKEKQFFCVWIVICSCSMAFGYRQVSWAWGNAKTLSVVLYIQYSAFSDLFHHRWEQKFKGHFSFLTIWIYSKLFQNSWYLQFGESILP